MKIPTASKPEMKNSIIYKIDKTSKESNEGILITITDIFNEQVYLNDQFKKKIKSAINLIEFDYDKIILKKTIDSFHDSFDKQIEGYMETAIDFVKLETGAKKYISKKNSNIYEFKVKQNDQWMKDWVEQTNSFKIDHEKRPLFENDTDSFCYYVDVN